MDYESTNGKKHNVIFYMSKALPLTEHLGSVGADAEEDAQCDICHGNRPLPRGSHHPGRNREIPNYWKNDYKVL